MKCFPFLICVLALSGFVSSSWVAMAAEQGANSTITVFAASSATEVLTDLAKRFEANHPVQIRLSFASSSVLARQIEQEAPCDIFLSADQKWMDYVAEKHKIQADSRRDIVGNRLLIVAPANTKLAVTFEKNFDFAGAFTGRIAMGDPDHVPAGLYAREALQNLGWWNSLTNRLAPAENVRAALKLVELGEVDAGIVYYSDAKSSAKVSVAGQFPESTHSAIRYPAALCVKASPVAKAFLEYMASKEAAPVWVGAGFDSFVP